MSIQEIKKRKQKHFFGSLFYFTYFNYAVSPLSSNN